MQSSLDLAPDSVVGGRYRLIESLARGGTASVWRAEDTEAGSRVAIKILRDEGVDPTLRERAGREAHVLEGLEHPNLVRVLDSGEDDGMPFMVMELLDGSSLATIISERGTLDVDEAVTLVADVADGLGAAHARGVIHRDVKPANIVCHDQVPTLVDFGIARNVDATTLTRGLVMGTASYLAPEQAQGMPLTPAVDVYALGCVLYELLTGAPPFVGDSPVTVALRHVQDEAVPPADVADVPAAVNALVLRALAKDPAHRPTDGAALASELRAALQSDPGDETVTITPVSPDGTMVMPAVVAAPDPDAELIDPSPLPPVPPPAKRPTSDVPWPLILGIVVAALVLLLLVRAFGSDPVDVRSVPDGLVGSKVADATAYLEGAGLEVDVNDVESDQPAGTVIGLEPGEGEPVAVGGTVALAVSSGSGDETPATTIAPPPDDGTGDGGDRPARGRGKKGD
ncbi:MAG TPA: protein kinase [Acidimicrobiales bacterium]|nr:protein kinase [Acidimicrobiales bacterium]